MSSLKDKITKGRFELNLKNKMKSKFRKGFTLIELLVVIAIIGILASIVLVSFPGATKKAKDSRIVSAIAQARTVMTYVSANDGDYDAFECAHVEMGALCKEIDNNYGTDAKDDMTPEPTIGRSAASGATAACIWSPLNVGGYYCADSTGIAGFTAIDPATLCPAAPASYATSTCPAGTAG